MRYSDGRKVIDIVEGSLLAPLPLGVISQRVGYSSHHLHRQFRRIFGLTIDGYSRRRRLSEAARLLVEEQATVTDVAFAYGYGSQQSFTRAFVGFYGLPPGQFRRDGGYYPLLLPYLFEAPAAPAKVPALHCFGADNSDLVEPLVELSRAAVDMLPKIEWDSHRQALECAVSEGRLHVATLDGVIGGAIACQEGGRIDFLAIHPLVRGTSVAANLLRGAQSGANTQWPLSVTTFRRGDRADLGHRAMLERMSFTAGQLGVDQGYPVQVMELAKEYRHFARGCNT